MAEIQSAYAGIIGPSGDKTGIADATAISNALSTYGYANLRATTGSQYYYIGSTVTLPSAELNGHGATVVPVAGISGPVFSLTGNQSRLLDIQVYGGTTTRSANAAADVVVPAAGAIRWRVDQLDALYCNGWVINPAASTAAMHGSIRAVRGTNNAGGIQIAGGTSSGGQIVISDIDLQSCEVTEALFLTDITDILLAGLNLSVTGAAGVPTMHISDACQTILGTGLDIGVTGTATAGVGVLLIEDANGHSPSEIDITSSTFQAGGIGVLVNGGAARLRFRGVMAKKNKGDGWQFNGTGTAIVVADCAGNTNNQAAGTAYDVNVTSTAHVGLFDFAYCSGAVTNSRNITSAGNHVSDVNSTNPGGQTTTGNAPGGW